MMRRVGEVGGGGAARSPNWVCFSNLTVLQ
jgi:hypothetical protein